MARHVFRLVTLLTVIAVGFFTACGGDSGAADNGPQATAEQAFQDWAKTLNVAYRNDEYETVQKLEAFATIRVSAEFQDSASSPWVEQEAEVEVIKQGDTWQSPTQFAFGPTLRAQQTSEAVSNATATVEAMSAAATQQAEEVSRNTTATIEAANQQANEMAKGATATAQTAAENATAAAQAEQSQANATATALAPTATPTPSPTPTPTATPLPSAGTVLYETGDWSDWHLSGGWVTISGLLTSDGSYREPIVWSPYDPTPMTDYAIEAEIQVVGANGSGNPGGFCKSATFGLIARGGDDAGYLGAVEVPHGEGCSRAQYAAKVMDLGDFLTNLPYNQGLLSELEYNVDADWHTYRIEVIGTTIRLLIDGAVIAEINDNSYLQSGLWGLWSYATQISIRSFKVIAL